MTDHTHGTRRTAAQRAAAITAATFLLVGVLGFVPGITTSYGDLELAGHESGAQLLGIFEVSVLHNVVHLLFGVAGLLLARRHPSARQFLVLGGVAYLALWLYGVLVEQGSSADFVPLDDADNWLHLVLGIAMLGLGALLASETFRQADADGRSTDPRAHPPA